MNDKAVIRTWIDEMKQSSVKVCFQILKKDDQSLCADGEAVFVLIDARSGRPEKIPDDIKSKYSI